MTKHHVICSLPNASLSINGVEFTQVDKDTIMTAEPVDAHIADHFCAIPGYTRMELDPEDQAALEEAERAAARIREKATKARAPRAAKPVAEEPAPVAEEPAVEEPAAEVEDAGDGEAKSEGADDSELF